MKTDYIELFVYDDGDISLVKRQAPSLETVPGEVVELPQKDVLQYGATQLDELREELRSYGCEDNVIHRSIMEVLSGGYGETTYVK